MVMTFLRGWLAGGASGALAGALVATVGLLLSGPDVSDIAADVTAGIVLGGVFGAFAGVVVGLVAALSLALLSLAVRTVWQARMAGAVAAVAGAGTLLWRLGGGIDLSVVGFLVLCAAIGAWVGRFVVFGNTQPV